MPKASTVTKENKIKEFLFVSSPFPSGAAWLINFFLEVGILTYLGKKVEDFWDFNKNIQSYTLTKKQENFSTHCPILLKKKKFIFRDDISIRFGHEFPNNKNINKKTILFIRDGRDAIYSHFKRFQNNWENFNEMLNDLPVPIDTDWPHPRLPYPEIWALFNYLWSEAISEENLLTVKFEDIKTNPIPVLKKILDFIEVNRTDKEINFGIKGSSFESVKKAEEEYKKISGVSNHAIINRGGKIKEWEQVYDREKLNHFKGFPDLILNKFGYETKEVINFPNQLNRDSWGLQNFKNLRVCFRKFSNDPCVLFSMGKKILAFEWMKLLCNTGKIKELNKAPMLFRALLSASELIPSSPYLQLEVSKSLAKTGFKKQSLSILRDMGDYASSRAFLRERGMTYALNYHFSKARKDFLNAGLQNWFGIFLSEKMNGKHIKYRFKNFLSFLPLSVNTGFYKLIRGVRLIFCK
ncbi:MAG: sulfotransferase domain-containing protein [Candidatus Pacebacteria bacterium]|nr:sulfotransferase domain-containing protein [Candidatus Paceibacterota bacterium]